MDGLSKYLAEFIGTFCLVFCGTGAIIIDNLTGGQVGSLGIAATFGTIVLAMIYSFGEKSGAHINPAVSIAFWASGRFKGALLPGYISAQFVGGILASFTLALLFPNDLNLGATLPQIPDLRALIMEVILTFILMLVIIQVSTGSKEIGTMAGIAIGGVVFLEAAFAGPVTGASMNPARSLGPALVSGNVAEVWIYFVGPICGALLGILVWKILNTTNK